MNAYLFVRFQTVGQFGAAVNQSISPDQFVHLLTGGEQLISSEHCKVRCPAASTALASGESPEYIFAVLIDSLVHQLPGQCEFSSLYLKESQNLT